MCSLYQTALRLPHDQKDHKREQKTVLTLDTQTVEPSQTTTYFCALWIGTVKTAKTTTNSCSAFSTTFGSCFDAFFLCKIDPKPRRGSQENALSSGSCTSRFVACGPLSPLNKQFSKRNISLHFPSITKKSPVFAAIFPKIIFLFCKGVQRGGFFYIYSEELFYENNF